MRATLLPTVARIGVTVRPIAVTICQNAAASGVMRRAATGGAEHDEVVSDGLAINMEVSSATPRRAPVTRRHRPVTTTLMMMTAATATQQLASPSAQAAPADRCPCPR